MSLKAYEDACIRAELFGQPKPDKEDFLEKHKHLDVVEFEEVEIKTAEEAPQSVLPLRPIDSPRIYKQNTAMLNEQMTDASGGLTELNTILNSTQTKLNKLKGVCGSLTNFFRVKLSAKDNLSYSSEPSYIGQTNYDKDYIPPKTTELGSINEGLGPEDNEMSLKTKQISAVKPQYGNINAALEDLDTMQKSEANVTKPALNDISKQVTSQISKLDQMVSQADRAQTSLQHQNKQMRSFLR